MAAAYDFEGKTILVTGAGAGIGKAICERLVKSNAKVIAVSLVQEELTNLKKELPDIQTIQVDLSDWAATRTAISSVVPVFGLVNNAGVGFSGSVLDCTEQVWDITQAINSKAVLNVTQVVAKSMIENNIKGSVVNISSVAALTALKDSIAYCASKGAIQALTRSMALELGPYGIRVNSVNPTFAKTNLTREILANEEFTKLFLQRTPLGRYATVEDVSAAVVFLLSEESSMVHGIPLPVDGGYLA